MRPLCPVGRYRPVSCSGRILLNLHHRTPPSPVHYLPREWHILMGRKGQCIWEKKSFTRIVFGSPCRCSSWAISNDYLRVSFHYPLTQLYQEWPVMSSISNALRVLGGHCLQKECCGLIYELEIFHNSYNNPIEFICTLSSTCFPWVLSILI